MLFANLHFIEIYNFEKELALRYNNARSELLASDQDNHVIASYLTSFVTAGANNNQRNYDDTKHLLRFSAKIKN